MTPLLDILAGMLVGTLMGLIASAHAAILFAARPPEFFLRRLEDGGSSNLVTIIVFGLVVLWTIVGVVAALVADLALGDVDMLSLVPSSGYLIAVIVVLIVVGLPMMLFMRDRWIHGAISLVLAFGIYGFLIPNAVIALQNRT